MKRGQPRRRPTSSPLLSPLPFAALCQEVPVAVHGTTADVQEAILSEGLKSMSRGFVHFAPGLPGEDGVISGMRRSCEVLIYLDVAKALSDGMPIFVSSVRNNARFVEGEWGLGMGAHGTFAAAGFGI